MTVSPFWMELYSYAWFVGFGISFAVYGALSFSKRVGKGAGARESATSAA